MLDNMGSGAERKCHVRLTSSLILNTSRLDLRISGRSRSCTLSADRPGTSTRRRAVLAKINWVVFAATRDHGAVRMNAIMAMIVVTCLWAFRAVRYGVVSNDATGMSIAMKPHCGCCRSSCYERV